MCLQRLLDEVGDLADDAAAEGHHADDEDHTLHDGHPRTQLRQVVMKILLWLGPWFEESEHMLDHDD